MSMEKEDKKEYVSRHRFPLWLILGLLITLYLVIVLGLFTLKSAFTDFGWKTSSTINKGQSVEDYLGQVVQKKSGSKLEVVLTDNQVTELLASVLGGIALSDARALIESDGVIISGKYAAIIPINVDILLVPTVVDERIVFSIGWMKSFGVPVPKTISDMVGDSIAPSLNRLRIADDKVSVEKIELTKGQLKITGTAR
ncbi:MAG: hypothetical protein WCG48_04065 [Candidatus Berkelbacteria bacterium]